MSMAVHDGSIGNPFVTIDSKNKTAAPIDFQGAACEDHCASKRDVDRGDSPPASSLATAGYPSKQDILFLCEPYPGNPLLDPNLVLTTPAQVMEVMAAHAEGKGKGAYVPIRVPNTQSLCSENSSKYCELPKIK